MAILAQRAKRHGQVSRRHVSVSDMYVLNTPKYVSNFFIMLFYSNNILYSYTNSFGYSFIIPLGTNLTFM